MCGFFVTLRKRRRPPGPSTRRWLTFSVISPHRLGAWGAARIIETPG